ncbi:MAG: OsmC family protein [Mucilaginibacter polytrichastri]|nr:OsmC family protein [Mucilaginibacter polytrichastri]
MKVALHRLNDAVHLEALSDSSPVKVQIDGSPDVGGQELGVRPMELVLMALASCASMDLIHILKKQKQVISEYSVSADGKRREEIPTVFTDIHLVFQLKGDIDPGRAEKAAELAVKKYCSVHDMLAAGGVNITYQILIN